MQQMLSKQFWTPLKMPISLHWTTTAATSAALAHHACALLHQAKRLRAKRTGLRRAKPCRKYAATTCIINMATMVAGSVL